MYIAWSAASQCIATDSEGLWLISSERLSASGGSLTNNEEDMGKISLLNMSSII